MVPMCRCRRRSRGPSRSSNRVSGPSWAAGQDRCCSEPSPSTPTGGCPSGEPGSPTPSRPCAAPSPPRAAIPTRLEVVPFGTVPDEGKLAHYEAIGCSEVVLRVPSGPELDMIRVLDDYVRFLPG